MSENSLRRQLNTSYQKGYEYGLKGHEPRRSSVIASENPDWLIDNGLERIGHIDGYEEFKRRATRIGKFLNIKQQEGEGDDS